MLVGRSSNSMQDVPQGQVETALCDQKTAQESSVNLAELCKQRLSWWCDGAGNTPAEHAGKSMAMASVFETPVFWQ